MADATVSQTDGTITETPASTTTEEKSGTQQQEVVKETPKSPTLAETEKAMREAHDKSIGRDPSKFVGYKKEEPKPEVKTEVKAEVKAEEPKVDAKTPEVVKKPSGASRFKFKMALAKQENELLKSRLADLEARFASGITPIKKEEKAAELQEPVREKFNSDLEYFTAVRAYDKEVAKQETQQAREQRQADAANEESNRRYQIFNEKLQDTKAKHPDWADVAAKSTLQFNPILDGVVFSADPEFLYYAATHQRQARNLNDMNEQTTVAVGNGDNIAGLLQYLAENPDDIDKLNVMNPIKAQTYVGKLEERIEKSLLSAKKSDTNSEKSTSPGADADKKSVAAATEEVKPKTSDKPVEADKPKPTTQTTRERPEPAPKLQSGQAPNPTTWTDPTPMSMKDRETLFRDDPRFSRRGR